MTGTSYTCDKGRARLKYSRPDDAAPILFGLHFSGGSKLDMSVVRLNPYHVHHVVTSARDEAWNKVLDDIGHVTEGCISENVAV